MSSFMKSSIGKKFFMSVTGLFLITFICVHLSLNLLLIFDDSGDLFNMAAHFMATNPAIKIMEPVLALGFLVHIIWSFVITLENRKARPISYNSGDKVLSPIAPSKNMLILGGLVLAFLVMHIAQFWWKFKITHEGLTAVHVMQSGVSVEMENAYAVVAGLFKSSALYCIIYIVASGLLGLHISHGFWSALHTIGWNNQIWRKRLEVAARILAWVIAVGFAIIPLYFMIKF
ncbi:succinate dehydrogenase cytochrome b subunit [Prolixibacteraceae bacterium]|nr:succinate dehydrogenase cytochrome b subunit [Prolixibacteraceae bacterium]